MKLLRQIRSPILLITFGVSVAWMAYSLALSSDNQQVRRAIQVRATTLAGEITVGLDAKYEILYGLQALFNASKHVDADEFSLAAAGYLKRDRMIEGLEWIPRVAAEERQRYEQQAQARIPGFKISDAVGVGDYVAAQEADEYFPIYYLEPSNAYRESRGLNLNSYSVTKEALSEARDTGRVVVSDVLSGIENSTPFSLVFATLPIYKAYPITVEERRKRLQGFVAVLFLSENLFQHVVDKARLDDLIVRVEVLSGDDLRTEIFESDNRSGEPVHSDFAQEVVIDVANERWLLSVAPTAEGIAAFRSDSPRLVFCLVLGFAFACGIAILVLLRQRSLVAGAVVERTCQLNEANIQLEKLSNTDFLTGLANRREFESRATLVWNDVLARPQPFCVLMIDVDQFKQYNDSFGHLAGDTCLKRIAQVLRHELGGVSEVVARYGGEEFVVLLSGGNAQPMHVSRALQAVSDESIAHALDVDREWVTVSIGAAWVTPSASLDLKSVISSADEALYKAKETGRNKIVNVYLNGFVSARS